MGKSVSPTVVVVVVIVVVIVVGLIGWSVMGKHRGSGPIPQKALEMKAKMEAGAHKGGGMPGTQAAPSGGAPGAAGAGAPGAAETTPAPAGGEKTPPSAEGGKAPETPPATK